jgi:hypothetical protein
VTYTWSCGGSLIWGSCTAAYQLPVVTGVTDLSIKKYVQWQDAQTNATAFSTTSWSTFNYTFVVKNEGPAILPVTSLTVVTDTLPAGVTLTAVPSGAGWTCWWAIGTNQMFCNRTEALAVWASFPTITVPVKVVAAPWFINNQVIMTSTSDTNPANNTDPAVISVALPWVSCVPGTVTGVQPGPITAATPGLCPVWQAVWGFTGTTTGNTTTYNWSCGSSVVGWACTANYTSGGWSSGWAAYVGKICVNGVPSCANYNTREACISAGVPSALCYTADSVWQNQCTNQSLSCAGPGGGPGGTYSSGFCGDGVLQSGEECDVVGAPWCKVCKIDGLTNPGANPITDLWMNIPTLAGTNRNFGTNWLDGESEQIAFADNRVVVGNGTRIFTLADRVWLWVKTTYQMPLIIPADKRICLTSAGTSLNSESICTTFWEGAALDSRIKTWTWVDGTKFVNIGTGYYQRKILGSNRRPDRPTPISLLATPAQKSEYDAKLQSYYDWREYEYVYSNSVNNITFFKGSSIYPGSRWLLVSLRDAFVGEKTGTDGKIWLITDTGVNLVSFDVRVSAAVVASIGSSANRSLEQFLKQGSTNPFAGFLGGTSFNTSTTINNAVNNTTTVPVPVLSAKSATTPVTSVTDLEKYAVNGNKNVLSISGSLTIDNCGSNNAFVMEWVRTVVVTGDLIIKCNIVYGSNDATSSWAWITKGGDIQVSNGIPPTGSFAVTNLAGVYVSLSEGWKGWSIIPNGMSTTQTILKIDGSMYGNASPLFNSRLYARANGAYDILTTGTILSYSNRALVSPPPLLSQYLGAYKVVRVVQ